jgi:3-phenylpropionate/cinnamic acid dioxygenase small subunit
MTSLETARKASPEGFDATVSTYVDRDYYALLRHDMSEWRAGGKILTTSDRESFEEIINLENWLLDQRRLESWYELYSRQCIYWIPASDDLPESIKGDPERQVTIAFDDRRRLADRIAWLRTGLTSAQQPFSRTSHLNTGFMRVPTDRPGEVKIRSQFLVQEVRGARPAQILSGWMGHVFIEEDEKIKIDRKVVCLTDASCVHHNLTYII